MNECDRFKPKKYPHLDWPLSFEKAKSIVEDPAQIAQRAFWPFIAYEKRARRYKREGQVKIIAAKNRGIRYASHIDGYIYSYYGARLRNAYEKYLSEHSFSEAVVGYRAGLGSNIRIAKGVYDRIQRRKKAVVGCYDISSFFDSIDHKVLKQNLKEVLGFESLHEDWYNIFKSMTKYSYIARDELETLGTHPGGSRYCDAATFRALYAVKVKKNEHCYGIPQGAALSDVFSNVYMIKLDYNMNNYIAGLGGLYRRYADDILIVCCESKWQKVESFLHANLQGLGPSIIPTLAARAFSSMCGMFQRKLARWVQNASSVGTFDSFSAGC